MGLVAVGGNSDQPQERLKPALARPEYQFIFPTICNKFLNPGVTVLGCNYSQQDLRDRVSKGTCPLSHPSQLTEQFWGCQLR